ncbi:tRNA (uridine(54)-C5)-methyltransferase TrmA, partial [Klebsiella pneumoniae]
REMIYRQVENSFTQPNAAMNIQMLEWALDVTKGATGDLLELYSANHIDNVQIIRMAAEEFTQAMNGVRQFNRLQGIDLHSYQCET